ncbi:sensor histidine kinase [Rhodothermus profundi]|uniref:histidine kinase n=1 Tax=Rhodothermus profundi TaxID=633813 RepID=A0A1M6QJN2_9BACT|nr:HAMP domain-containing sensor histidine kinase [Rhodothermus profundi]SHK20330.1 Signal transduction histidine kinase [Rhodothermus profundi]
MARAHRPHPVCLTIQSRLLRAIGRWTGGILLLLGSWPLQAQELSYQVEVGAPLYLQHYAPQDYGQFPQNWAIVQDRRGVIYVGNVDGVLEFDGVHWRLLRTATNTIVRSLDVDTAGRIFVGAQGDFGYFWPDSLGVLRYTSLVPEIADSTDRNFWDVWATRVTPDGVYFQTHARLFRWDGDTIRVWRPHTYFHTAFVVHGRLYVRQDSIGLQTVAGDSLRLVPGGERFAHLRIYAMMPYDAEQILIATREAGLWLYDGRTFRYLPSEVEPFIRAYPLYHGTAMPGGFYALATLGGGVFIIDREGRIVQVIDESVGLPDSWVNYVYVDRQGSLWMALNSRGLARADAVPYLSVWDKRLGLDGFMYWLGQEADHLYAATSTGLFHMSLSQGSRPVFVRDVRISDQVFQIFRHGEDLWLATAEGLHIKKREQVLSDQTLLLPEQTVFSLARLTDSLIAAGTKSGLVRLRWNGRQWAIDPIAGVTGEVLRIVRAGHTLWLSLRDGRIVQMQFLNGWMEAPEVTVYGEADGLPGSVTQMVEIDSTVFFYAREGVYRFVPEATPVFQPDSSLIARGHEGHDELLALVVDRFRRVWTIYPTHVDIAHPLPGGGYRFETPLVLRYPAWGSPVQVYVDEEGIVWLGNRDRLIRYDPTLPFPEELFSVEPPPVLIRQVAVGDHVLFGGAFVGTDGFLRGQQQDGEVLELPYAFNDLQFEFALPSFIRAEDNRYQYRLEGKEDWSDWTTVTQRFYPNLWEGVYRFQVRARNAWGLTTPVTTLVIRILPPWYRTWWAYTLYLVILVTTVALTWRHYVAQQRAQQMYIATVLGDRIHSLTARINLLTRMLREANAAKETILSTTTHELRTPLSAILGFASVLKEETDNPQHQEFLELIEESGQRLLATINDILDLARLRSGSMVLRRVPVEITETVQKVYQLLEPLARKKGLDFRMELPTVPVRVFGDPRAVERVLNNLVGNAIKFTPRGEVVISVTADEQHVRIAVRDTGEGISEEFLPHVFEEFRQESSGTDRAYEGSGLGLAIAARLVKLMGGTIEVASKKGEGSTFTVVLPRAPEHGTPSGMYPHWQLSET